MLNNVLLAGIIALVAGFILQAVGSAPGALWLGAVGTAAITIGWILVLIGAVLLLINVLRG